MPEMPNPKDDSQKDPGAKAVREAWALVLREGRFFQGSETRARLEQELQNQQPTLGEVRPDDGL